MMHEWIGLGGDEVDRTRLGMESIIFRTNNILVDETDERLQGRTGIRLAGVGAKGLGR